MTRGHFSHKRTFPGLFLDVGRGALEALGGHAHGGGDLPEGPAGRGDGVKHGDGLPLIGGKPGDERAHGRPGLCQGRAFGGVGVGWEAREVQAVGEDVVGRQVAGHLCIVWR